MPIALLSFLADVERSLLADDPAPDGGIWENSRTVNYHLQLARVNLGVRQPEGRLTPRGTIQLQGFKLADGAHCVKAALTWNGTEARGMHAIYSKPSVDWKSEARRLAAVWQAGPPNGVFAEETAPLAAVAV
jgi:hypothetical protein